jgi:hypothetical protein
MRKIIFNWVSKLWDVEMLIVFSRVFFSFSETKFFVAFVSLVRYTDPKSRHTAENLWVRGWVLVTFHRHAKKAQRRLYNRGNGSQLATLGYITQTQEKALDLIFEIQNGYNLGVWKTSNPLSAPTAQNNNTNWTASGMSRT